MPAPFPTQPRVLWRGSKSALLFHLTRAGDDGSLSWNANEPPGVHPKIGHPTISCVGISRAVLKKMNTLTHTSEKQVNNDTILKLAYVCNILYEYVTVNKLSGSRDKSMWQSPRSTCQCFDKAKGGNLCRLFLPATRRRFLKPWLRRM